jgi:hypothetical protein
MATVSSQPSPNSIVAVSGQTNVFFLSLRGVGGIGLAWDQCRKIHSKHSYFWNEVTEEKYDRRHKSISCHEPLFAAQVVRADRSPFAGSTVCIYAISNHRKNGRRDETTTYGGVWVEKKTHHAPDGPCGAKRAWSAYSYVLLHTVQVRPTPLTAAEIPIREVTRTVQRTVSR